VVADNGVCPQHRLSEHPEGRRLYDKVRPVTYWWSGGVDRLGRNYVDVCDTIRHFMRRCVVIRTVINNSRSTPIQQAVRDALI
jgi:putative DNA-invertase from lambdoid prophage Rac